MYQQEKDTQPQNKIQSITISSYFGILAWHTRGTVKAPIFQKRLLAQGEKVNIRPRRAILQNNILSRDVHQIMRPAQPLQGMGAKDRITRVHSVQLD